jgi:hypothetical protein
VGRNVSTPGGVGMGLTGVVREGWGSAGGCWGVG